MESLKTRRDFLCVSAVVGTGLVLSSCAGSNTNSTGREVAQPTPDGNKMGGEVTATEDLMREHGILRPASYADVLVAQHNRGREITDYITLAVGAAL
jgi:hypothetical protein